MQRKSEGVDAFLAFTSPLLIGACLLPLVERAAQKGKAMILDRIGMMDSEIVRTLSEVGNPVPISLGRSMTQDEGELRRVKDV